MTHVQTSREIGPSERAWRGLAHAPAWPPSCSTGKSWLHFRPPPVDFCSSRLAIGAATERARALAMPAGTRAQALTNATLAAARLLHRRSPTAPCSKGALAAHRKKLAAFSALGGGRRAPRHPRSAQ